MPRNLEHVMRWRTGPENILSRCRRLPLEYSPLPQLRTLRIPSNAFRSFLYWTIRFTNITIVPLNNCCRVFFICRTPAVQKFTLFLEVTGRVEVSCFLLIVLALLLVLHHRAGPQRLCSACMLSFRGTPYPAFVHAFCAVTVTKAVVGRMT